MQSGTPTWKTRILLSALLPALIIRLSQKSWSRSCLLYTSIYPYQDILEIVGDTKVEGVHFKSTQNGEETTVKCDGVFEYIGLTPTTDCFKDLDVLNKFGYVEVDERMATKVPGIFGAGDCVTKNLRQVITCLLYTSRCV